MWVAAYWAAVGIGTLLFGLNILFLTRDNEGSRFYPEALALYVLGLSLGCGLLVLVVVLARGLNPHRHFFAGTPVVVVVGILVVLVGGHAIAYLADRFGRQDAYPRTRLEHDPSPAELATAEAYDDQWQAEYRAEHHAAPQFADWQAEYLKKHPKTRRRRFRRQKG